MLVATSLGVALAIGLARWSGWGSRPANSPPCRQLVSQGLRTCKLKC
jgi:hypothetical protein